MKSINWTPYQIRFILSIYTGKMMVNAGSAAHAEAIAKFEKHGLTRVDSLLLTEKGECFITLLLETPLPQSGGWINPDNDEKIIPAT
jgi:hypothetical protein